MIPVADLDSVLADWLPPLSLIVIATAYAIRMIHLSDQGRPGEHDGSRRRTQGGLSAP